SWTVASNSGGAVSPSSSSVYVVCGLVVAMLAELLLRVRNQKITARIRQEIVRPQRVIRVAHAPEAFRIAKVHMRDQIQAILFDPRMRAPWSRRADEARLLVSIDTSIGTGDFVGLDELVPASLDKHHRPPRHDRTITGRL